jgi:hypothetical protein
VDPRLRRAIDANIGWCEDILALHGIGSVLEDGLWSALGPPPPLHPDAVTVEPDVRVDQVAGRLGGRNRAAVKDSFATLDLSSIGMDVLFDATWIHREPAVPARTPWRTVSTAEGLAAWNAGWDTADVLLPPILELGHIAVLARAADSAIEAGAVARLGIGVVELSNVHGVDGRDVDWNELVAAVAARFPDRPIVGYEAGSDLEGALDAGFEPVGDLRVWARG